MNVIQDKDVFTTEGGIRIYMARCYSELPMEDFRYSPTRSTNHFWIINPQPANTGEALSRDLNSATAEAVQLLGARLPADPRSELFPWKRCLPTPKQFPGGRCEPLAGRSPFHPRFYLYGAGEKIRRRADRGQSAELPGAKHRRTAACRGLPKRMCMISSRKTWILRMPT